MKNILLLFAILLMQIQTFAQQSHSKDYSYTIGEPYQVHDAVFKDYFTDGKSILSVKYEPWKGEVIIQKFDVSGLREISMKEYDDLPKNYYFEGLIEANTKYYFFYSSWSGKDTKHERLYSREINFETGEFMGEGQLLIDIQGKLGSAPQSAYVRSGALNFGIVVDKFDVLVSKDESKIIIQYRKKPKVKKDKKSFDVLGFRVYDNTLNQLWEKEYKMPYTERRMNAADFEVDSKGNGYILAKVFHDDSNKDKKRKKDIEANYHIEILRLVQGNDAILTTKVDLKDKFVNGISFFESPDGVMVCAGYYTNGKNNKLGNVDGVFMFKISEEGIVIDESTHEIPVEVLNQYVKNSTKKKNERKDKKDKAEFENLAPRELIIHQDGSFVLIGEQFYVKERSTTKRTYYTYHNNDMLVSKIDALGNLVWMKKLPKRQAGSQAKGGMSYSHFFADGNHYLVFLDNVKNIDLPLDKIPERHTDGAGGYLTAYKIGHIDGEVSKGSIFDTRNIGENLAGYQFSKNRIIQTADDEFVIEFYKKKKEDILIKVKIIN